MSDINLDGLFTSIILIMVLPTIIFATIGVILLYNQKKKTAKVFFILAVFYVLISLGVCGSMMLS